MDIILVRGTKNAGKSTTAALTYSEVFKVAKKEHLFNAKNVDINSLKFDKNGNPYDFEAILTVNGKVIVIISAGDDAAKLMDTIAKLINFVQNKMKSQIDVLICCGRSINKNGSVYMRLKEIYPSAKLTEIWPAWTDKKSEIDIIKKKSVDIIITLI